MLKKKYENTDKKLKAIANSKNITKQVKEQKINNAYNQYFTYLTQDRNRPLSNEQKINRGQYYKDLTQKVNIMKDYPQFDYEQVEAYKTLERNIEHLKNTSRKGQPNLLKKGATLFPNRIINTKDEFHQPALQKKWEEWENLYNRYASGDQSTVVDSSRVVNQSTEVNPSTGDKGSRTLNIFLLLLGIVLCLIAIYFVYMQFTKRRQQKIAVEEPVVVVEEEPVVVVEEEPVVVVEEEPVVGDVVEENNSFFFFLVFVSLVTIYYFKFKKKTKRKTKSKSKK